jgi:hypothetical protein
MLVSIRVMAVVSVIFNYKVLKKLLLLIHQFQVVLAQ